MSASAQPARKRSYLRAHSLLIAVGLLYVFVVVLVMTPFIQTHVLYAHYIDSFGYTKFNHPEIYGLAPGKTLNMKLRSSDNTTIGAWFMYSEPLYQARGSSQPLPSLSEAVQKNPTILFLHGNTGTRALPLRVALYTAYTARLSANVFTIDYRGFGDSEGHPTVAGVAQDARAAWDYLMDQGARPEDVLIVGHSLGTAVAGLLAGELGREHVTPRGVVLMAPFSSVRALIDQYYLFGCLPLLKPLSMVPLAPRLVSWSVVHKFDTLSLVPDMKSSVLLVHAENDWDIPHTHSSLLFDAFLALPADPVVSGQHALHGHHVDDEGNRHGRDVSVNHIHGFGTLQEAIIPVDVETANSTTQAVDNSDIRTQGGRVENVGREKFRTIAMLKTTHGNHDIGKPEGVQDVIGRMFKLL